MAKYYFTGTVGSGIYARAKAVAGYFFGTTALDAPYYAGLGVGFGFLLPIGKTKRWHLGIDGGVKLALPFGYEENRPAVRPQWGLPYYTLLSPASIPELSIRIAYRL